MPKLTDPGLNLGQRSLKVQFAILAKGSLAQQPIRLWLRGHISVHAGRPGLGFEPETHKDESHPSLPGCPFVSKVRDTKGASCYLLYFKAKGEDFFGTTPTDIEMNLEMDGCLQGEWFWRDTHTEYNGSGRFLAEWNDLEESKWQPR